MTGCWRELAKPVAHLGCYMRSADAPDTTLYSEPAPGSDLLESVLGQSGVVLQLLVSPAIRPISHLCIPFFRHRNILIKPRSPVSASSSWRGRLLRVERLLLLLRVVLLLLLLLWRLRRAGELVYAGLDLFRYFVELPFELVEMIFPRHDRV